MNLICSVSELELFQGTTFLPTTISLSFQESVTHVPGFCVTSLPGLYHAYYMQEGEGGGPRVDLAIEDYSQAILLDPDNPAYYAARGDAYYKQPGGIDLAIEDYDHAILLDPTNPSLYLGRGIIDFDQGLRAQEESAIKDFDEAIRLDPVYAEAYLQRGMAYYFAAGDAEFNLSWLPDGAFEERAKADVKEAIRLDSRLMIEATWLIDALELNDYIDRQEYLSD